MSSISYNPDIRFAPGLFEIMRASVGLLPPEHYAILGGPIDDPYRVTDLMPMPPALDMHGRGQATDLSVTLNAPFIEYYINTMLLPFRKDVKGIMHSHPGDFDSLSGGIAGSGQGDIPSMRAQLETAAMQGLSWDTYLAPIVTRPGSRPKVTGWIIRLDKQDPIPADVIWERSIDRPAREKMQVDTQACMARLDDWQERIDRARQRRSISKKDREHRIAALKRARLIDFERLLRLKSNGPSRIVSMDSDEITHL